jgi:hypothetical protein
MKNIDHHHHVISISITIISRGYLPVMGQPEVVISNMHDVTPNVWLWTERTVLCHMYSTYFGTCTKRPIRVIDESATERNQSDEA